MTNQTHLALESVKFLSKKIHKYPKYIRKPLVKHVKHSRGSVMNLSFAEDSLSTCDLHSNAESFSFSEEEKTEDLSIKVKLYKLNEFFQFYILRFLNYTRFFLSVCEFFYRLKYADFNYLNFFDIDILQYYNFFNILRI